MVCLHISPSQSYYCLVWFCVSALASEYSNDARSFCFTTIHNNLLWVDLVGISLAKSARAQAHCLWRYKFRLKICDDLIVMVWWDGVKNNVDSVMFICKDSGGDKVEPFDPSKYIICIENPLL